MIFVIKRISLNHSQNRTGQTIISLRLRILLYRVSFCRGFAVLLKPILHDGRLQGYDSGFSILLSHSKPEINVRFGEEGQERDIGNSDVAKHQAYSPTVGSYPARLYYPSNRQYRTRITFYT